MAYGELPKCVGGPKTFKNGAQALEASPGGSRAHHSTPSPLAARRGSQKRPRRIGVRWFLDARRPRRRERTRSQPRLVEIKLGRNDDAGDASSACVSRWRGTRVIVAWSGRARASYWIDSPRPFLRLVGLCPFGARTARRPQRRPGPARHRDASPARARAKSIS